MKKENIEYRSIPLNTEDTILRAFEDENGERFIEGKVLNYNVRSRLLPPKMAPKNAPSNRNFYEVLAPGAFRESLSNGDNIVSLTLNHKQDQVIARTLNETLTVTEDDDGVRIRAKVPRNVSFADEAYEQVRLGTYYEMSFGFVARKQDVDFSTAEDGTPIRTIKRGYLFETSVLSVKAAYPNTEIAIRQLEEHEAEVTEVETEEPDNKEQEQAEAEAEAKAELEKEKMKMKIKI